MFQTGQKIRENAKVHKNLTFFQFTIHYDELMMSYGTKVNISLVAKNESTADPIMAFMLTAYDQYGINFGRFVEDQRYLLSVSCENLGPEALTNPYSALMNAGPLVMKEFNTQWVAESKVQDEPVRVYFYLTLILPEHVVWKKKHVATLHVV